MVHYEETIRQRVSLDRVARFLRRDQISQLKRIFGNGKVAVWGSRTGPNNRTRFDRMNEGDDILIVEGSHIKLLGKAALKTENPDLSRELWKNIKDGSSEGWDLIYFIANPIEIDVPFEDFCLLFEYAPNYRPQGFSAVAADKLEAFYDRYDDLYSILLRLKAGERVQEKDPDRIVDIAPGAPVVIPDLQDGLPDVVSDHVRMQWTLANLGLKAGQKIWVPANDQSKLRSAYQFTKFEAEFSSGIDLPHSYVENIDVVWKEQYRIDAAFEIENSTAIYSGLLRFADLMDLAPNTTYPMFIVAPSERRSAVRAQLHRPAFRGLDLRHKVRFLPYEAVEAIDRFFPEGSTSLNINVIKDKAEVLL